MNESVLNAQIEVMAAQKILLQKQLTLQLLQLDVQTEQAKESISKIAKIENPKEVSADTSP